MRLPATGNDDLVSAFVQLLRAAASDPRATPRDENRVSRENHELSPLRQTDACNHRLEANALLLNEPPSSIRCAKFLRVARILHRPVQYAIMNAWGDRRTSAGKVFWRRHCLSSGDTASRIPASSSWRELPA